MTTRSLGGLALAGGLACVATPAFAQEPPVASAPRGWHAAVAAEGGVERNPRFQTPSDSSATVSRVRATLGGLTRVGRTQVRVTGDGAVARYGNVADLDRTTYTGALDVERAFTPRLTGRAGALLRTTSSSEATAAVAGPLLPEAIARTRAASGAVAYRTSPRTTVTASADAASTRYDEAALAGGWTSAGHLGVTRRTGPASSLGGALDVQHATAGDRPQTVVGSAADWSTAIGRVQLRVAAGASALLGTSQTIVRPVGDASAAWRVRAGTIALHAGRTVAPAAGIGRVLATDQAGVLFDRTATSHLALHAALDGAWSADPSDPSLRLDATTATTALRWSLGPTFRLDLGAFLRQRTQSGSTILNHGFTFGVGRTLF